MTSSLFFHKIPEDSQSWIFSNSNKKLFSGNINTKQTSFNANLNLDNVRKAAENDWVVLEKIHGSCFCFIASKHNSRVLHASRRAILDEDPTNENNNKFFGFASVAARLDSQVQQLCTTMTNDDASIEKIVVYGELFGGVYPISNETNNNNNDDNNDDNNDNNNYNNNNNNNNIDGDEEEIVQTEILYSSRLEFMAFDLAVQRTSANVEKFEFLDYLSASTLFNDHQIPFVRPLSICNFTTAMAFNIDFPTTIPAQLVLPSIENNFAEGIVVKPAKKIVYVDARKGPPERAVLKRKSTRFVERVLQQGNHDIFLKRKLVIKHQQKDSKSASGDGESLLLTQLLSFLNKNRVNSAFSKLGKPKSGKQGDLLRQRIIDEVVQDIYIDANNNTQIRNDLESSTAAARDRIRKQLIDAISKMMA